MTAVHHFAADDDPEAIAAHIADFGYAIVDDVAAPELLDQLQNEAAPYIAASDAGRDQYDGRFTRRTGALIARCPAARELVMHPLVMGTVGHFLSHASAVQLHLTQIITIDPGETSQKLHRDQMAFDFYPFPRLPRAVQHDVGLDRLHRRQRRDPHPVPALVDGDDEARRSVDSRPRCAAAAFCSTTARCCTAGVPISSTPPAGREHHLRRGLGPTRGEPVPRVPARDGSHTRRRAAAA